MAIHRAGRTFTLYLLFIVFSAAWLSTVFLYYGSFAPANSRGHPIQNTPKQIVILGEPAGADPYDPQNNVAQIRNEAKTMIVGEGKDRGIESAIEANTPAKVDQLSKLALAAAARDPSVKMQTQGLLAVPLLDLNPKGRIEESTEHRDEVAAHRTTAAESRESPANSPIPLSSASSSFKRTTTTIMILACKRPHYLEQTLNSLIRLEGVGEYDIVISQDGNHQGVRELADSFVRRYRNVRLDTPPRAQHSLGGKGGWFRYRSASA